MTDIEGEAPIPWAYRAVFLIPVPVACLCGIFRAIRDIPPVQAGAFSFFAVAIVGVYFVGIRKLEPMARWVLGQSGNPLPTIKKGNFALYVVFWRILAVVTLITILSIVMPFKFLSWFSQIAQLIFMPLFIASMPLKWK
jgi:hypothetical protein